MGAALAVVLTGIVCVNIMAVYSSIGIVWNRSQGLTTLCLLLGCVYVAFLAARVGRYVARRLRVPLRPVVIVSAVLVGALALLVAPGFVRDLRASMATIVKRAAASDARMSAIDAMRREGRCDPLPTTFIVGMQEGYDLIATPSPINIRFSQYYGFSCQVLGDMTRQEAKRTVAAKPR